MSLASLTAAIQTHIDPDMEALTAEGMAEHALGFFGFYDRIIDNALEPTDRNLFYMFQDYDLLTTESEETTLWDGREWRIHYWKFKPEAVRHKLPPSMLPAWCPMEPIVRTKSRGLWLPGEAACRGRWRSCNPPLWQQPAAASRLVCISCRTPRAIGSAQRRLCREVMVRPAEGPMKSS